LKGFSIEQIKPGPAPDNTSLQVSQTEISFFRPAMHDIVFLDIQLPGNSRVRLLVDGKPVFNGFVRQPLAFRNDGWGEGATRIQSVVLRAAIPQLGSNAGANTPVQ
jgi:hypothetical protein